MDSAGAATAAGVPARRTGQYPRHHPITHRGHQSYWTFAQGYYVKNGKPTDEIACIKAALRLWRRHFGGLPAREFDSLKMLALQQLMIDAGWSRKTINSHTGRVKRALKWMVSRKLVPATVWAECATVPGLEKGRTKAKETARKLPVPAAMVEAVKPFVSKQVWALIQLESLCGARSGELVGLRKKDIDRTGDVWTAAIAGHKTEHHDHERVLHFGKESQAVLAPFLMRPDDAYLFSPREAEKDRREALHAGRETPDDVGNEPGDNRAKNPKRNPGDHYTPDSYRVAITHACRQAFPVPAHLARQRVPGRGRKAKAARWESAAEWKARLGTDKWAELRKWEREHHWHPHRLRHSMASRVRAKYGVEAAKLALGVKNLDVAEIYAERDAEVVKRIFAEVG